VIPDQKEVWDRKHLAGEHEHFRESPSSFALVAESIFGPSSKILELGCGVGRDAVYFAEKGHDVVATDLSEVVIIQNRKVFDDSGVRFQVLDMRQPMPFDPESFDVVYANLSLHYYTDQDTRKIVQEVTRVLKPNGVLAFACKSTNDFHYGNGKEIERDVFVGKSGHVRHLFSIEYTQALLQDQFQIELIDEVTEEYSAQKSAMVRCIARKMTKKTSKSWPATGANGAKL